MVDYDYDLPPNHPAEAGGSPLSSLTADQLAENVRDSLGGPDYAPMDRRWEDVAADAEANLAELQTRANQRDNLAGLEELLAQTEERVRLLKIYALAAEKERDKAQDSWRLSAAGLVATEKERDEAKAEADRLAADKWLAEKERDEWKELALTNAEEVKAWRKRDPLAAEARLAETRKALERIVAAADADAALNLRDIAFIARAALTTHPTDEA